MIAEYLVPLAVVLAITLGFPRKWLGHKPVRVGLILVCLAFLARYLVWRFSHTVLPAQGWGGETLFVWGVFSIELLVWTDTAITLMALMRQTDRTPEADRHEARLRAADAGSLPTVDVLVTTYNEPFEVLEKSILGSLALEWPSHLLNIYVLDDGRRDWLRDFCDENGVHYLTRPDNADAKAGNINAALPQISGQYFMVLDADFVPQQNLLFRAMGFFEDPDVGIVQIPHSFFNADPMQTSLQMQSKMPDDQRLFFDVIMPGRDGWDCAFCCGSNSITSRKALETIGDRLPTGSTTEDIFLTVALLRQGYITRYLNERLAIGLAPESLTGFFVQRRRWAQGALQMVFSPTGPLGPGLKLTQRAFFLPIYWVSSTFGHLAGLIIPVIFFWTGFQPLVNATTQTIIAYQIPAIVMTLGLLRLLAPTQFFPLTSSAQGVLQAFRLLPVIFFTILRPRDSSFKVTPKGIGTADTLQRDRFTILTCLTIILATVSGIYLSADFHLATVSASQMVPIVIAWSGLNLLILLIVLALAVSPPRLRAEERFPVFETSSIRNEKDKKAVVEITDMSLSGAALRLSGETFRLDLNEWFALEIPSVGEVPCCVRRVGHAEDAQMLGVEFYLPEGPERTALVQKLFTEGRDNTPETANAMRVALTVIHRIFDDRTATRKDREKPGSAPKPPEWVRDLASRTPSRAKVFSAERD